MIVYVPVQAGGPSVQPPTLLDDLPGTRERRTEQAVVSDAEDDELDDPEYTRILLMPQKVRQLPAAVGSNHVVEPFATACRQEKVLALKAYHAQKQSALALASAPAEAFVDAPVAAEAFADEALAVDPLAEEPAAESRPGAPPRPAPSAPEYLQQLMTLINDPKKTKKADLATHLRALDLPFSGSKPELLNRLRCHLERKSLDQVHPPPPLRQWLKR